MPPTRRSTIERPARNYAEQGGGEAASESDDEDIWEPAVGPIGAPPPDAVVINLVSSDEDGPAMLSSHPSHRDGLFIAPSTVQIEQGPLAGTTLQGPGLFTAEALPAGSFVCMYTGTPFARAASMRACHAGGATSCRATPWRWTRTMLSSPRRSTF